MTTPLGGLAAGFVIEQAGLTAALLTLGGLYFLANSHRRLSRAGGRWTAAGRSAARNLPARVQSPK